MTDEAERFATPRVAAGALFLDHRGWVLLVKPTYKDGWDIPGGYVEHGESPAAACEREVHEELGAVRKVRTFLSVDWAPSDTDGDKLLFLFDCGTIIMSEIQLAKSELSSCEWVHPQSFDSYLPARLSRRLESTLAARKCGTYLENGQPLSLSTRE